MRLRYYDRDITAADVDEMGKGLLAAIEQHEREIALAQRVADALKPISHYKKIDIRAIRQVRQAIADSRASISYTKNHAHSYRNNPEYLHFGVGANYYNDTEFAQISIRVDINAGMADLVAACEACEYSRQQLASSVRQYERMEDVIDAEEEIRGLARQIEEIRRKTKREIVGEQRGDYWHDSVSKAMPSLTGREW